MLIEEMTEVQKPSVVYEDNQGEIFLASNRQVGMHTKHIGICHYFLRGLVEYKYMGINYIRTEENPADIMTKNFSESDYVKQTMRITEVELWELVETVRDHVKNNRALYGVMDFDSTEYWSHTLAEVANGGNRNEYILVTISMVGK